MGKQKVFKAYVHVFPPFPLTPPLSTFPHPPNPRCQVSFVRCQVSGVRCQVLRDVSCHLSLMPTATATDPPPAKGASPQKMQP